MNDKLDAKAAPSSGAALSDVGRAHRFALADGRTLWRLPQGADAIALRLAYLGEQGIGGFEQSGRDAHGPWLVRRALDSTLSSAWPPAGTDVHAVLERFCILCRALAHCEARSLFAGALRPRAVWVDPTSNAAGLCAEPLVAGLLGDATATSTGGRLSRWSPPRQAAGEPWDNAANRYVVGLMLYRALAGRHPFGDKGMRLEFEEQARRGAPPMPESVAAGLIPGLHSYVLRMLDPDARNRPSSASELAQRLGEFAAGPRATPKPTANRPSAGSGPSARLGASVEPAVPVAPAIQLGPRRSWKTWLALAPLAVGATAAYALSQTEAPPAVSRPSVAVSPRPSLDHTTVRPDDCATCHPNQAAQWHGSVMAHSVKSPLFAGLEILIEEQVARSFDCPNGAGVLRAPSPGGVCREPNTGLPITGSGGALWCVNCHSPGSNLDRVVARWDGTGSGAQNAPAPDLLPSSSMDGISCIFCHTVDGPAKPGAAARGEYEGNPNWVSFVSGLRFSSRPEDRQGVFGIGNSGYSLRAAEFLLGPNDETDAVPGAAHRRPDEASADYLRSSEFCGSCHDVRLFGTDAIEGVSKGEHFKRLRNAYSEWVDWAALERRAGREPASCQDCHMSLYPGVCVPDEGAGSLADSFSGESNVALERACPPGTSFSARAPGSLANSGVATSSTAAGPISSHAFTGVDIPLTPAFPERLIDDPALDANGVPRGAKQRRDLLLGSTFRFEMDPPTRDGRRLEIPIELENIGAGHKVPAGFSQEREFWVHLTVTDAAGRVVYEVGRVDRNDEDLHDKEFVRVNVDDSFTDAQGQPLGVFGADVVDGRDVPQWRGSAAEFRGRGLINLQNGFLRCVTCIGELDRFGRCQPGPGQGRHRADRFADGAYDIDTGECVSNLRGEDRFLEVYFPVGALDSTRGLVKGPDAIIDSRSASPSIPQRYVYELDAGQGPLRVEARLMFRAFPPFLVKAFADYEALAAARGRRPSGPLVTRQMLERIEVVELHRLEATLQ